MIWATWGDADGGGVALGVAVGFGFAAAIPAGTLCTEPGWNSRTSSAWEAVFQALIAADVIAPIKNAVMQM